jgi:hypothetical protein
MRFKTAFMCVVFCLLALMLQGQTLYRVVDRTPETMDLEKVRKITLNNHQMVIDRFGTESETISLFHLYNMSTKVLVTSVEEQPFEPFLRQVMLLFPNPAQAFINIKLGAGVQQRMLVEVISIDGRVVYKNHHTPTLGEFRLDLPQLPGGVYICRVKGESINHAVKFLIK